MNFWIDKMDVFISYSRQSAEGAAYARQLYSYMESRGLKVFLDTESLRGGDEWKEQIREKIRAADWVFYVVTKEARVSETVQHEIGAAWGQQKKILPILLDDIAPESLPPFVNDKQAIDARDPDQIRRQVEKIAKDKDNQLVAGILIAALAFLISK